MKILLQVSWSWASSSVECGGEESLAADPNWWEAVLEMMSTSAMSRTSVAADPGILESSGSSWHCVSRI